MLLDAQTPAVTIVGKTWPLHVTEVFQVTLEENLAMIADTILATVGPEMFKANYADVFKGDSRWNQIASPDGAAYQWDAGSTYIKNPPYFDGMTMEVGSIKDIHGARVLGLMVDAFAGFATLDGRLDAEEADLILDLLRSAFPEALAYFEDDAFINGTGAGQPKGWLNADAAITLTISAVLAGCDNATVEPQSAAPAAEPVAQGVSQYAGLPSSQSAAKYLHRDSSTATSSFRTSLRRPTQASASS